MRRYERISVVNRRFRSNGGRLTQNVWSKGSSLTNHFSSQKTKLNDLSCGVKIWTDLYSILSQITRLTDRHRWTDGRTEFSSADRVCIACSAVKWWKSIRIPNFDHICQSHVEIKLLSENGRPLAGFNFHLCVVIGWWCVSLPITS